MNTIKWQNHEKDELDGIRDEYGLNLAEIELGVNPAENEKVLQEYTNRIRKEWVRKVANITSEYSGSPWRGTHPIDAFGEEISYTYGTLVKDAKVAYNLAGKRRTDRVCATYLYNNGMAAIRSTIGIINSFIKSNLKVLYSAGYFETRVFFDTLLNCGISVNENVSHNVFFFEPIQYLLDLPVTDFQYFIDEINKSSEKVKFVIIDMTMDCTSNIFDWIKQQLINECNVVYIEIRSGIKQDQFGLEFSNLGIASWYVHEKNSGYAETLFKYIATFKDITGENVSYNTLALCSRLSTDKSMKYRNQIHDITKDFVSSIELKSNRYITNIISPSVKNEIFECSIPFVFVKFNLKRREAYEKLLDNIIEWCDLKGVFLPYRNSFGFRYPSIEYICDFRTKECVMKFSLGVFKGYLFELIHEVICDLANGETSSIKEFLFKDIEEWTTI